MNDLLIQDQLAQQLRQLRKRRGLTQAQVADLARIDRKQVILVEKGLGSVSFEFYSKIIAALGCTIEIRPATRPTLEELQGIFKIAPCLLFLLDELKRRLSKVALLDPMMLLAISGRGRRIGQWPALDLGSFHPWFLYGVVRFSGEHTRRHTSKSILRGDRWERWGFAGIADNGVAWAFRREWGSAGSRGE